MLHLSSENLYDYFSTATSQDSATIVGKKLFDFVDRQSKTLVITIGDSWTWGADLTQTKLQGTHLSRLHDDNYRIEHVFGNLIADHLQADFLNLGESGAGNWRLLKKFQELADMHHLLDYEKIFVFGIWTELGRDLDSHFDRHVDYRSWLLDNIVNYENYYDFMHFINNYISNEVSRVITRFDKKYKFYFGTNFVDPIGVDGLSRYWMDQTWLQVICEKNNRIYQPAHCYTVFPWCIEKFRMVFDVAPELDRNQWLKWVTEITEHANLRAQVCARDDILFLNLLHPSAHGHRNWANYMLKTIDCPDFYQ